LENKLQFDKVGFKLFPYQGDRVFFSHDHLKQVKRSDREVISDAFIFEPSKKTRLFVLVLLKANVYKSYIKRLKQVFFTLGVSFN
jgi:hypothetical protein